MAVTDHEYFLVNRMALHNDIFPYIYSAGFELCSSNVRCTHMIADVACFSDYSQLSTLKGCAVLQLFVTSAQASATVPLNLAIWSCVKTDTVYAFLLILECKQQQT